MSHGGLGQAIFDRGCSRIADDDRRNRDDGASKRRLKSGSAFGPAAPQRVASRSPEVAHSCSLRFEEPECIDEPRQFRCSGGNSTLRRGDPHWRGIRCSLKLVDTFDRGVERLQLSR